MEHCDDQVPGPSGINKKQQIRKITTAVQENVQERYFHEIIDEQEQVPANIKSNKDKQDLTSQLQGTTESIDEQSGMNRKVYKSTTTVESTLVPIDATEMYKKETIATGPEYKGSGIKTSLHGIMYQVKLLTLFLNRGINHGYKFSLATELDDAEKFDDLVFSYDDIKGGQLFRFLQAKHRQDGNKKITLDDLLNDSDEDFSILKYFISYRKIKQKDIFKGGEFEDFIICTNIDLHEDVLIPDNDSNKTAVYEIDSTDDKLFGFSNCFNSKQYKFTNDSKVCKALKLKLKHCHSDKLAAKLAKTVSNKEKTVPKDELFKSYRGWLLDNVFKMERDGNGRCLQFGDDFLEEKCKNDESLIYFRKALITGIENAKPKEHVHSILQKTKFKIPETFSTNSIGCLSLDVTDEEVDTFLKKFVLAVNQPNEDELQGIITKEIGREMNFINGEFIASRLQQCNSVK